MTIKKESGEKREFGTGANKQAAAGKGTPVLFPGDAYLEVCKHFEAGAEHYEARNWEKGIPLGELINSLERHIADEKMGDISERHDRAIGWNAIVYLATKLRIQRGILPKSLDDMPTYPVLNAEGIAPPCCKESDRFPCTCPDCVAHEELRRAIQNAKDGECVPVDNLDVDICKGFTPDTKRHAGLSRPCAVCLVVPCTCNKSAEKAKRQCPKTFQYGRTWVKPTKRLYMSHSIRGRKGVDATSEDMEANNLLAIEAGKQLKILLPDYDVYVPGSHDELVIIGFEKGYLNEQKILDIDCAIIDKCDMVVAYTPDGYLSHGMVVELRHAKYTKCLKKSNKNIQFFDGERLCTIKQFNDKYHGEWLKIL